LAVEQSRCHGWLVRRRDSAILRGVRVTRTGQTAPVPLWQRLVWGGNARITVLRAALLGLACWLTFRHLLLPVRVSGISMEPTIHNGSVNLVNRLPYFWREPRRGEIVALRTTGTSIMYLKRIVGLPNETVEIRAGAVLIGGRPLEEPYLKDPQAWEWRRRTLGPEDYLVIGDNRTMPMELHEAGVVKRARIVGKALWQQGRTR
jgi:signal peptidase I